MQMPTPHPPFAASGQCVMKVRVGVGTGVVVGGNADVVSGSELDSVADGSDGEYVMDDESVCDGDPPLTDGEGVAVDENEPERLYVLESDSDSVADAVPSSVTVGVRINDSDGVSETLALVETDALRLRDALTDSVSLVETDCEADAVSEADADSDVLHDADAELETETEALSLIDCDAESVWDSVKDTEPEAVEVLPVSVSSSDSVGGRVSDGVPLCEIDKLTDTDDDTDSVSDVDSDVESD